MDDGWGLEVEKGQPFEDLTEPALDDAPAKNGNGLDEGLDKVGGWVGGWVGK